jgi:biopolymer transport protein ExbD
MRYQPHVFASDKPMSEINTTPIIDVMLVLIVVMLLSLPMQTHKLPIELPQAGPGAGKPHLVHKLALDAAGSVRWDGKTITTAQLDKKLAELAKDPPKTSFADANSCSDTLCSVQSGARRRAGGRGGSDRFCRERSVSGVLIQN